MPNSLHVQPLPWSNLWTSLPLGTYHLTAFFNLILHGIGCPSHFTHYLFKKKQTLTIINMKNLNKLSILSALDIHLQFTKLKKNYALSPWWPCCSFWRFLKSNLILKGLCPNIYFTFQQCYTNKINLFANFSQHNTNLTKPFLNIFSNPPTHTTQ